MHRGTITALALLCAAGEARADDGLGGGDEIRGDGVHGLVAFTFDDGPSGYTPRVLATLAAHDVPATFFVVGKSLTGGRAPRTRKILADIVAAGHDVGNHTFGHARLPHLPGDARDRQIDDAGALIAEVIGHEPTTLRPPYGERSDKLERALVARGLTAVLWNIDPEDWRGDTQPAELRARVVAQILASGGGIVILHDTERFTAAALPGILTDLEAANCRRLARGRAAIIPVSLHYFVRDGDAARPVPPHIEERTQRYRDGLAARCAPPSSAPHTRHFRKATRASEED